MYEYTGRVHVWWKPDKQRHAALTCIINAILRYRQFHELQMALIMSSYTTTSVNTVCANSRPGPDTSPANGRCQDALWRHRHCRSLEHWQTNRHRHSVVDSSRHWLQISPDAACDSGSERAPTQHATSTRIEHLSCWVLSRPPPTPVEQEIAAMMATGCRKTVWRKHHDRHTLRESMTFNSDAQTTHAMTLHSRKIMTYFQRSNWLASWSSSFLKW